MHTREQMNMNMDIYMLTASGLVSKFYRLGFLDPGGVFFSFFLLLILSSIYRFCLSTYLPTYLTTTRTI